ncbi:MAG: GNAT family N-acetyltransferase [Candidatus Cyclonatronum sp.]|uniref:GNAT family N-acetyltransferase n=1 Tax=Cyclonatronum sp. TaxID=3024185 RepID=UPI0025C6F762|nr:GNAT family N-acetyltransferase [Cyclonatronum sp.]MCH8487817.1 GNAT family N-acetyltransferase [Cyclonatronum sp.]
MFDYQILNPGESETRKAEADSVIDFLFEHLDQFGDPREDIAKCAAYALSTKPGYGGFIVRAWDSEAQRVAGAVIVNETGMKGYIPENLLVYIAVHSGYRGKGLGKGLMKIAMDRAEGDIALHVEPDNPARYLYEKLGFTNKYLEMRWKRS